MKMFTIVYFRLFPIVHQFKKLTNSMKPCEYNVKKYNYESQNLNLV